MQWWVKTRPQGEGWKKCLRCAWLVFCDICRCSFWNFLLYASHSLMNVVNLDRCCHCGMHCIQRVLLPAAPDVNHIWVQTKSGSSGITTRSSKDYYPNGTSASMYSHIMHRLLVTFQVFCMLVLTRVRVSKNGTSLCCLMVTFTLAWFIVKGREVTIVSMDWNGRV